MTSTIGSFFGFSLIELIVVVAIISSIMFAGSLYFQNHLSGTILKTSAQDIASTLLWTRRLAISERKSYKVVFHPGKGKYWVEDTRGQRVEGIAYLNRKVRFADPELGKWGEEDGIVEGGVWDNSFFFYPQGTAEGGSIYLRDGKNNWYTITIAPTTGGVRVYPEKH